MFALNPIELVIVAFAALFMLAGAVVLVVLILTSTRKRSSAPNPNLLPCLDCGRFVSRIATSCPQCGRPMNSPPG